VKEYFEIKEKKKGQLQREGEKGVGHPRTSSLHINLVLGGGGGGGGGTSNNTFYYVSWVREGKLGKGKVYLLIVP